MFAAKPAITIASFDSFLPATSCHSALLLQVLQAFSLCFDSIWCPSRQRNQQDAVHFQLPVRAQALGVAESGTGAADGDSAW